MFIFIPVKIQEECHIVQEATGHYFTMSQRYINLFHIDSPNSIGAKKKDVGLRSFRICTAR